MIKSVTVTNYLGESLKMELTRPETSGFYIESIEGLGPCKADINIVENGVLDGASYLSARVNSRNIIITLGFAFASDAEEARHKSYKYFPLKKNVKLLIETDRRVCETYGYVESNEPNIFSQNVTTQISIICPDSYFYSAGENSTNITLFSGIESKFEFPFSNESSTENTIVFGEISNEARRTVFYSGEAEIGMTMYIHAIGDASNVVIHNIGTRETMTIRGDIIAGDDIIISTVKGNKFIKLLRNGEYTNIMNRLDRYSDWFQLTNGDNVFGYEAENGSDNLQFRVENRIAYEGV